MNGKAIKTGTGANTICDVFISEESGGKNGFSLLFLLY